VGAGPLTVRIQPLRDDPMCLGVQVHDGGRRRWWCVRSYGAILFQKRSQPKARAPRILKAAKEFVKQSCPLR
jgi:hypothetical protein